MTTFYLSWDKFNVDRFPDDARFPLYYCIIVFDVYKAPGTNSDRLVYLLFYNTILSTLSVTEIKSCKKWGYGCGCGCNRFFANLRLVDTCCIDP